MYQNENVKIKIQSTNYLKLISKKIFSKLEEKN